MAAHRELQSQLHQQQAAVGAQRDRLEEERRQLAGQRGRDPIIAAAIQDCGVLIACLLPLLVCVYLLHRMAGENDDQQALGELLVHELTAEQPRLLPAPPLHRPAALGRAASQDRPDEPMPDDETEEAALPF